MNRIWGKPADGASAEAPSNAFRPQRAFAVAMPVPSCLPGGPQNAKTWIKDSVMTARPFAQRTLLLAATVLTPVLLPAQLLDGANWFEREVGDGVTWRYYQFDELFGATQSVSYLEVDLQNPGVDLVINFREAAIGPDPAVFPRARTSAMAAEIPGAKGAINGTFFNTSSYDPDRPNAAWGGGVTYLKVEGNVVHPFDGSSINSYGGGFLFNGTSDVAVHRKTSSWASVAPAWENMMINGPILLEDGVVEDYDPGNTFANARHPRSAMGISADGNTLYLLAVDGRTGDAAGMSCTELAQVLRELGAHDAVNMDGGGSTTLWAAGEPFNGVVNYPSDNGAYDHNGERAAANALIVVANDAAPAAYDARLESLDAPVLARSGESFTVTAEYRNIGTQAWQAGSVEIAPSRPLGRASSFIPAGSGDDFFRFSPATVPPGGTATVTLDLVPPDVEQDTLFSESFALVHSAQGFFGPPDNALRFTATVRPELTGAPPTMIVQGGGGPNNQWYRETNGNWANSVVGFSAPGVHNPGTQRYVSASAAGRSAEFRPVFDVPGIYRVEVAFPASSNSISAEYTIDHLEGTHTESINQNSGAGLANQWNELGEFKFGSGTISGGLGEHRIEVRNAQTGNRIYSGAVRLDYVGPLEEAAEGAIVY